MNFFDKYKEINLTSSSIVFIIVNKCSNYSITSKNDFIKINRFELLAEIFKNRSNIYDY